MPITTWDVYNDWKEVDRSDDFNGKSGARWQEGDREMGNQPERYRPELDPRNQIGYVDVGLQKIVPTTPVTQDRGEEAPPVWGPEDYPDDLMQNRTPIFQIKTPFC